MPRVRFKVPTWNEGRILIADISSTLGVPSKEEDEYLIVEDEGYRISMMPDDRGFAFFMIKYSDESLLQKLDPLVSKYRE